MSTPTTTRPVPATDTCPGHFAWSAFGATYPDTVCATALEWTGPHPGAILCDADDDFSPWSGIPCPMCDPTAFLDYLGDPDELIITWTVDDQPVPPATTVHFHEGPDATLYATAAHPTRGDERVRITSALD